MESETLALLVNLENKIDSLAENSRGGVQADISGFRVLQSSGNQRGGYDVINITGEGYIKELILASNQMLTPFNLIIDGETFDCTNARVNNNTTVKIADIKFRRNIRLIFTADYSNFAYQLWMLYKTT